MSFSSRLRTTSAGAVLIALAFAASACGGSKADATDEPTPSTPVSTAVTPTPTPTPTAEPLSPFEEQPPVKGLRSWAEAVVGDVNARHRDFPSARQFEVDTDKVRRDVQATFQQEFDKYYPGPVPFTPVAVKAAGRQATVTACVMSAGFALKRPGGRPAEKREVVPVVFTMAKQRGAWLLAGILLGTADCSGVSIKAVGS